MQAKEASMLGTIRRKLMRKATRRAAIGLVLVVVWGLAFALAAPTAALACPACSKALEGTDLGAGFNTSILFLLAMPFAVVGITAGGLAYRYRTLSRTAAADNTLSRDSEKEGIVSTMKHKERGE